MSIDSTETAVPRRWVDFDEIDNLRDLGGLPVTDGGTTRFGVAYRSSTPQQVTAADVGRLTALGLRTLIDLRLPAEVDNEGYGLLAAAPISRINLPVGKAEEAANPAALLPDAIRYDLVALYRELLAGSVQSLVSAIRHIADPNRHAVVFHCAAGKDRTGVLTAMVLDAVGVPAAAIAADYALTDERMQRVRDRLDALPTYHGLPPLHTGILGVDPDTMLEFLADLHTRGGAAAWLQQHGLTDTELEHLRTTLVQR